MDRGMKQERGQQRPPLLTSGLDPETQMETHPQLSPESIAPGGPETQPDTAYAQARRLQSGTPRHLGNPPIPNI